ncbi:MAG TPA: hypothetical protein VJ813_17020 [Vicinamibacterales bacterium]|nr:hypothetical protein [Vicinamibacterales bacterium]
MPRGRARKKQGGVLMKSAEMIGWAVGGIEREIQATRERLTALTSQARALRSKLPGGAAGRAGLAGAGPTIAGEPKRKRRRRQMSPEARKRISEMMKKRWAERRKAKASK